MNCLRCGAGGRPIFESGLCGICDITENRQMNVVGLSYGNRSRLDEVNPYRDTMRAIEMMAQTGQANSAELQRWARQARETLPDRATRIDPELNDPLEKAPVQPAEQAASREAEGAMIDLWQKAKYERAVLRRKPVNEIQKRNYDLVDAWEKSS